MMIANISPAVVCFEDTYNTLNFANRTKNIKTNVIRNVLNVSNHIANYVQIINNLKQENEELKKMISGQSTHSFFTEFKVNRNCDRQSAICSKTRFTQFYEV